MLSSSPKPILFNPWKHHAWFITRQIQQAKKLGLAHFTKAVKTIGNNQMDMYVGDMSPAEIGKEILDILQEKQISTKEEYKHWITQGQEQYRLLTIKDESVWTLLWSQGTKRYIHIHPARYAPHTMRVKGTSLKTVILSCAYVRVEGKQADLSLINHVRKEILGLSPVQRLDPEKGLGKVWRYFTE